MAGDEGGDAIPVAIPAKARFELRGDFGESLPAPDGAVKVVEVVSEELGPVGVGVVLVVWTEDRLLVKEAIDRFFPSLGLTGGDRGADQAFQGLLIGHSRQPRGIVRMPDDEFHRELTTQLLQSLDSPFSRFWVGRWSIRVAVNDQPGDDPVDKGGLGISPELTDTLTGSHDQHVSLWGAKAKVTGSVLDSILAKDFFETIASEAGFRPQVRGGQPKQPAFPEGSVVVAFTQDQDLAHRRSSPIFSRM
jgi:hypothetical protein